MNQVTGFLLTFRFWAILMHFIITICIFYTKISILQVGIEISTETQQNREYEAANTRLITAWGISLVCFFVEFLGAYSGLTIFHNGLNLSYIVLHSCGTVMTLWQILEAWTTDAYLYIFAFCSLLPACMELAVIGFYMLFKFRIFKHIEINV
mmetsp:Transcript_4114/g.5714  ORF Transcript_4114/g.5714 Transcript_4114/m.5714 type:complete len:152 (-) Transcript_4114:150-605(-)